MKTIAVILIGSLLFSSCHTGNVSSRNDNASLAQPAKKIEDTARIRTCELLLKHLEKNDKKGVVSLIRVKSFTDKLLHDVYFNEMTDALTAARNLACQHMLAPKEQWIVKIDTVHYTEQSEYTKDYVIRILEFIFVPIDKRELQNNDRQFVVFTFNISELRPDPDYIDNLSIEGRDILDRKTNFSVDQ